MRNNLAKRLEGILKGIERDLKGIEKDLKGINGKLEGIGGDLKLLSGRYDDDDKAAEKEAIDDVIYLFKKISPFYGDSKLAFVMNCCFFLVLWFLSQLLWWHFLLMMRVEGIVNGLVKKKR